MIFGCTPEPPGGSAARPAQKTTQNYHLIALRSFLKYLKRDVKTLASEDRAREAGKPRSRVLETDLGGFCPAPDAADVPPTLRLRDRAMLELFFSTGLRVSELIAQEDVHQPLTRRVHRARKGRQKLGSRSSRSLRERRLKYLMHRGDDCPFLFVRHDRARIGMTKDLTPLTPVRSSAWLRTMLPWLGSQEGLAIHSGIPLPRISS